MPDIDLLVKGDPRSLAKAITLIESKKSDDIAKAQELLEKILPHTGDSCRVAISGVPGVGKSTFIEALGSHIIETEKQKVAVLAIDPSSPLSGGSVLGDKTRMEKLAQNEMAFIRPTPTSGHLGGVAQKTRECILLCEAAGFKNIFVETVGVGQSEYEAASVVDLFLMLMLPNAGDELQGIKRGIMELADHLIINKADGDNKSLANKAAAQYKSALQLLKAEEKNIVVHCVSALKNENIDLVWNNTKDYFASHKDKISERRNQQKIHWFKKLVEEIFWQQFEGKKNAQRKELEQQLLEGKTTPSLLPKN